MARYSIGFIGAGNMASAIIHGLLQSGMSADQLIASAPSDITRNRIQQDFGIHTTVYNADAARADIVMLCVKPQIMKAALSDIHKTLIQQRPLLVSVAAGITITMLHQWINDQDYPLAVIRAMPNTPALFNQGATGLYAESGVSLDKKQRVTDIFNHIGIAQWVDKETLIDAVIAVAGSAPAYYFLFMEAIRDEGIKMGLSPKVSEQLTLQTALGAATMALKGDDDITELRRKVCSPNGTTERAIKTFQKGQLDHLVKQAMEAVLQRSREMAGELNQ
ncbi:Pyrroline-5-carboxylate reductase [invertebrate metagenome]|uniref:Pyrroline-5-carboxylate reductase n=1 Tax=invertebrate metagenome TaxID=1711999 RepID=A0A2H9T7G5_9ZZZZ